jgi:hypothetical protein
MSEGCLLWHSRHCGRDTTGVLYKGPLTPSEKRAARLIRQALCINLDRIFAALSVRSWQCPLLGNLSAELECPLAELGLMGAGRRTVSSELPELTPEPPPAASPVAFDCPVSGVLLDY